MYNQIILLIYKDIRLELRKPYVLNGIILHTISTVFVCYLALNGIVDTTTWNMLLWIILLFSSVNAVSKSFVDEHSSRHLYYYSIVSPLALIVAKMIYNIFLMVVLSFVTWVIFSLFMGLPQMNAGIFAAALLLGSVGFALILTLVAAIASRAGNNFTLMAILSFPVVMPKLLILIKLSALALNQMDWNEASKLLFGLVSLLIIVVVLAIVLFPYLWKE